MSIKDQYVIVRIPYREAMELIVKNHYLHRKAPCRYSFGLMEGDRLVGVICYGTPASRSLQKGICGPEYANNVIELTRLWIEDGTPKNSESFFIANTLKLIPEEIIVSYAEDQQGHLGIVYQATNWIYTGLSDRHCKRVVEGVDNKHCRHIFDEYGGINKAKEILGDKMQKVERPRKHRYIFLNSSKRRNKKLKGLIKYKEIPYPKSLIAS